MSTRPDGDSPVKMPELKCLKLIDAPEPPRRNYPRFWVERQGDEAEEDELVSNDEVDRLVKLLEEDPNKLNEAEQDDLCRSVDVDTIMSLALKWGKKMGMDDFGTVLDKRVRKYPKPDEEEMRRTFKRMLRNPEKVKETQMSLFYTYTLYELSLKVALPSCKVKEGVPRSNLEELYFLSRFLPFKLFAHIFYEKTGVCLFGSDEETGSNDEEDDSTSFVRKREGDQVCSICEKSHLGISCPYMDDVPVGAKIGRDYELVCQGCDCPNGEKDCPTCGPVGRYAIIKSCLACFAIGECLKDDDKHRRVRAREAEAVDMVWDDEQDRRQYSPKWCSMCCDDDHSSENCGMKESDKEDIDECGQSIPLPFWVDKKGDGAKEDKLVSNDEVYRLLKLLEEDPNKLNEAEQDQLSRSVDVDTIMSLALKWGKKMGMDEIETALAKPGGKYPEPDEKEMHRTCKRMLRNPEKVKEAQMSLFYTYTFYELVLRAALLHSCKVKEGVSKSNLEDLFFLSRFLPFKLFAHVFYEKTGVRLFGPDEETGINDEEEDSTSFVRKREGDKVCPICEKIHLDLCPYLEYVPVGATIGRDYELICRHCYWPFGEEDCPTCGSVGQCAALKFCSVCSARGECLQDDDKHRLARAREAEAAESMVCDDDEQDYNYSPKWCSMCLDDDHSSENCGMKESGKEDTDECEQSK